MGAGEAHRSTRGGVRSNVVWMCGCISVKYYERCTSENRRDKKLYVSGLTVAVVRSCEAAVEGLAATCIPMGPKM